MARPSAARLDHPARWMPPVGVIAGGPPADGYGTISV